MPCMTLKASKPGKNQLFFFLGVYYISNDLVLPPIRTFDMKL